MIHGEPGVIKRHGSGEGQTEAGRTGRDELGNFWNELKRRRMEGSEGSQSPTAGRKRGPTACQEGRGATMTTCPNPGSCGWAPHCLCLLTTGWALLTANHHRDPERKTRRNPRQTEALWETALPSPGLG